MQSKDIGIATSIGILTGISGVFLFRGLGFSIASIYLFIIPVATVIIFITGLAMGHFLARWWPALEHFSRFVIIGFSNATIDFGLLNILILTTHITQGFYFSVFKTAGFLAALFNSYIWNRYWTFKATTRKTAREFFVFTLVVCVGLIINVGVSSLIVNFIPPMFNVSLAIWANIASAAAVSIGLFWNFLGMRIFIFKPQDQLIISETL